MNFRTKLRRQDPPANESHERPGLETELDALYATPAPPLTWEAAVASSRPVFVDGTAGAGRRWLRPGLVVAALAVAAVAIAVPLAPGRGGTGTVSAEELILRGGSAAEVGTYHLVIETNAGNVTVRTETWRDGPGRVRTDTWVSGKEATYGQVSDGETAWVYQSFQGVTRAAKFSADLAPGFADLSEVPPPVSLSDFVASLGVPGCQVASRDGDDELLGRDVYVIQVTATGQPCGTAEDIKRAGGAFKTLRQEATIWLDKETFMVLRAEYRDLDGGSTTVTAATTYEVGMAIPAGTFAYVAPAGVTVVEAKDLFELKQALAVPAFDDSIKGGAVNDPANAPAPTVEITSKP